MFNPVQTLVLFEGPKGTECPRCSSVLRCEKKTVGLFLYKMNAAFGGQDSQPTGLESAEHRSLGLKA